MDKRVPALPSATVVLLRKSEQQPELLMVKRRAGDAFGDSYAFPGGVVDHNESNAHGRIDGKTEEEANAILSVPEDGLDYYSAAVRELFEESGILLARTDDGEWATVTAALQGLRVEVDRGRLPWSEFLEEQGLRLACDALHYFAHWETPLDKPKRWSTRFFLAETPSGQDATHDGSEVTDICWLTAGQALAGKREGSMKLPFPTTRSLQNLSEFHTIDEITDWADARVQEGITRLCPIKVRLNGKSKWTVWGDSAYPHSDPL